MTRADGRGAIRLPSARRRGRVGGVPDSPQPPQPPQRGPAPVPASDVTRLFVSGRLVAIPRRAARREQLLDHLARTLFEPDRTYTEPEVNEALGAVHEDFPALRRYLVESGRLTRTRDGGSYRRAEPPAGPAADAG